MVLGRGGGVPAGRAVQAALEARQEPPAGHEFAVARPGGSTPHARVQPGSGKFDQWTAQGRPGTRRREVGLGGDGRRSEL